MIKGIINVTIDGQVIFQQNTIGIQDNIENPKNIDKPLSIQCSRGD
jgi:hypothetical protein